MNEKTIALHAPQLVLSFSPKKEDVPTPPSQKALLELSQKACLNIPVPKFLQTPPCHKKLTKTVAEHAVADNFVGIMGLLIISALVVFGINMAIPRVGFFFWALPLFVSLGTASVFHFHRQAVNLQKKIMWLKARSRRCSKFATLSPDHRLYFQNQIAQACQNPQASPLLVKELTKVHEALPESQMPFSFWVQWEEELHKVSYELSSQFMQQKKKMFKDDLP